MLPTKQMNEQINRMLQSDVITSVKSSFAITSAKIQVMKWTRGCWIFAKIVQTRENGTVLTAVCTSDAK